MLDAGKTDDPLKTIDYAEVYRCIEGIVTKNAYKLIETLAHEIANSILEKYGLVKGVVLTVSKPSAPIPGIFNNVSVTLTRERSLMRGCEND